MNNSIQPNPEVASKPPDLEYETAGMMLRKARESANLSLVTVGEALHLTVHYIKALENDEYNKLPGKTFVKGYMRAYARYLKIDVDAVLEVYAKNNVSAEELSNRTEISYRSQKRHDQTFRWAVITALLVVLGVAAGWWFVGKDEGLPAAVIAPSQSPSRPGTSQPPVTAASFARTPVAPAAQGIMSDVVTTSSEANDAVAINSTVTNPDSIPADNIAIHSAVNSDDAAATNVLPLSETAQVSAPDGGAINNQADPEAAPTLTAIPEQGNVALTITPTAEGARQVTLISVGTDMLQLYFKGTSWVEIEDEAKGRLYNQTLNSGDAITLHGTAPFKLLLGDAAQVELTFNSQPISLASQIRSDKTARFSLGAAATAVETTTTDLGSNP